MTEDERAEMLPSGNQRRFDNRLAWTITHLAQAGLLDRPRRGVTRLTDRGRQVLRDHPKRVDMSVLNQFPEYLAFRGVETDDSKPPAVKPSDTNTPDETIQSAPRGVGRRSRRRANRQSLDCDPDFFEQLVTDVLIAMSYGGSKSEAGERLAQTGDGGIDGVIREDLLGLDAIYLQAKGWDLSGGRRLGCPAFDDRWTEGRIHHGVMPQSKPTSVVPGMERQRLRGAHSAVR